MPQDVKFDIRARNKTDSAFAKVRKNLGLTSGDVKKLAGGVAGLLGIGAFTLMAKDALKLGDEIHQVDTPQEAVSLALELAEEIIGE